MFLRIYVTDFFGKLNVALLFLDFQLMSWLPRIIYSYDDKLNMIMINNNSN